MKFRYRNEDEMKDSDIEWIGKIPKHWNSIMFKRVIQRVNNGIWGDDAKSNSDDIPCIRVLNFNRNTMEVKIDNLTIRNIPRIKQKGYLLKKGDLLIEKSGGGEKSPVGFVVRYNYELPAVYANFMAKISLNNNTISEYIKYLCSAIYNRKLHLDSINQTTGIQNLDSEIYFKRYIALPNVLEQEKIAKFLDEKTAEFDSIIFKKESLVKKLEEAKKSLISEVVTGKVKVVKTSDGYELVQRKKEEMKDSKVEWLGEIPKGWKRVKVSMVANVVRGASPRPAGSPIYFGGCDVPWITVAEVTKDEEKYLNNVSSYLTNLGRKQSRFLNKGTLIMSNSGATLGVPKILNISGCINDGSLAFLNLKINKEYFYYLLKSRTNIFREEMQISGQPNLNTDIVKALDILVPMETQQELIAQYLDVKINNINSLIEKTKKQIEKLKEAKQSLISEAVTGKFEILE